MKKTLLIILCVLALIAAFYFGWGRKTSKVKYYIEKNTRTQDMKTGLELLRVRKDNDALLVFGEILTAELDNLDALWGEAEVLRRSRKYRESEDILYEILKKNPKHAPSLISLSYIAYKDDKLFQAEELINQVFLSDCADNDSQALAYMMLGAINSRRSAKAHFFNKIKYGTQIKCHFLKAQSLAPDLPEVHLALGSFYLLAPPIFGRNIDKAIEELELAVQIAPDFATANARLAQCYKKRGLNDKYDFYIRHARALDPENEVLEELK